MIEIAFPSRASAVHQLLGEGSLRHGQAQRIASFNREREILVMQVDAETGVECAIDHALAMHLKNP